MKLYADTPARRTRQIVSDTLVLLWVGLWVWLGRQVFDTVQLLQGPAGSLRSAGQTVEGSLTGAGDEAGRLPLVGDSLRVWLQQAAGSGTTLREAGTSMSDTVHTVALVLGIVIAAVPIALVVLVWAFVRYRFARRATTAQRFIDASADLDLFALRALARQPMTALARISDDPAGAWRRGDPAVVHALGVLELRSNGLWPPPLEPRAR
ncbi:hypothetical protein DFJ68_1374 [Terracoccus luteus]|uniref:Transmembrane protein n=1 Tax=Terracoccus luteus TaxID=53356 RepID=A0A495XTS3_9MICO|nr:hypothetical protein [Terracoccus luteus]RKT77941.1 hypothetical protein DFJ68_1374 [Terracoccus luteus]